MKWRKRTKKKIRMINIILEKDDQIKEFPINVGGKWGMLKVAKRLAAEGRKGWQLQNITGDPETAGMFMGFVDQYKKTNQIPVKGMIKAAGLSATPTFIKKLLKKDEEGFDE